MGLTAEALAKKHGTMELVVTATVINVRDPDDVATDPREYSFQTKYRGERFTTDAEAGKRFLELKGASKPGSDAAKFAEAGIRDPSTLDAPPSATAMISPEHEQVKAMKAAMGDRLGDPDALDGLDEDQLRLVAKAFAVPVNDKMSKRALVHAILHPKGASVKADAASDAVGTETNEPERTTESIAEGMEVEQEGSGLHEGAVIEATDGAVKTAAEHDVDLAEVEGTGSGGRITQPDVVKYLADHAAG